MMKAVLQSGFGEPTKVLSISSQVPKPKVQDPDHILVKVYATCVNTPDWAGTVGLPYLLRPIMGGGGFEQIDQVYKFEDAPAAVQHMASHRARGQVVIQVRQDELKKYRISMIQIQIGYHT
jgi:NADPH:quinone reductase-like Zn-dependent oxidoreductase